MRVLSRDEVARLLDLDLLSGDHSGRSSDEITVHKSMGHAVEDAAAAARVLERAQG